MYRLTRMLLAVHVVLKCSEPLKQPEQHYYWRASSKSWTSSVFESTRKLRTEDIVRSIHPLYLLWFLVVLLIFSTITMSCYLLLQFMYTSTRNFKQHSSLKLWTEQLKTFMYDGQFEQVMGERDILFVWHAFLFRFLSLEVSFACLVFFRL